MTVGNLLYYRTSINKRKGKELSMSKCKCMKMMYCKSITVHLQYGMIPHQSHNSTEDWVQLPDRDMRDEVKKIIRIKAMSEEKQ